MSVSRLIISIVLCSAVAACSKGQSAQETSAANGPPSYILEGTEVRDIRARNLQRDYQLFVSLPPSYSLTMRRYPVLFLTDANYAFPLVRSIARRISNNGQDVEEFILVGLSYSKGDTPEYSRRRDYTPTRNGDRNAVSDMPGRSPLFGEAEAYRRFIAEDVFPLIAQHYRADMRRKIYAGHSFGGLFGVHVLLTEPDMFEHYIIGSPSLWYDHRVAFAEEQTYANTHTDMRANVFLAVASFESTNRQSGNPRYNKSIDMIRDLEALKRVLQSRGYPGLRIESTIIDDEDHLTVFPALITRGLKWALPPRPWVRESSPVPTALARP